VESGSRGGHELRPPSQADAKFDAQRREIDELVQDHARVVAEAEAAVAEARAAAPVDALREEAKRRAQALRDALSDLPLAGARPESGRSSAALGREHGHAMADSLERGDLEQAVAAAENAAQALDDAERRRDRPYDSDDRLDVSALNRARRELADARRWAEQALEKLQREAENGAQDSLRKLAGREQKLAERASELSSADAAGEAPLPDDVSDRLRDASRGMRGAAEAMRKGDAREAIEQARDAQRALESARTRSTSESEDGEEEPRSGRADVPDRDDSERTREFRRRVLDGLGRAGGGRLAPAVKRYAEELLR
jgi:hypothetical protein